MELDGRTRLRYAVAATLRGHGPAGLAPAVRRHGPAVLATLVSDLARAPAQEVERTVDRLLDQGVQALVLGVEGYPAALAGVRAAPVVLFVSGARHLLGTAGVGVCGSRHASDFGLVAAGSCGEVVAALRLPVVSGYARGVDVRAHVGALRAGGTTVLVLAEGIDHFTVRKGEVDDVWDDARTLVVSQFSPGQTWNAGAAMTRNAVISGLGRALVVIEAGATGGTLAAGMHALGRGQPVIVLDDGSASSGNRKLLTAGALRARDLAELSTALGRLPTSSSSQLSLL